MASLPIIAELEKMFFHRAVNAQLEFFKNDKGEVTHRGLHQAGRDIKDLRK